MNGKANWELLVEAAHRLCDQGLIPFSRRQLLDEVQRLDPDRNDSSLGPVLQGMTVNAEGGPPSAAGQPFVRVGHGLYELDSATTSPPTSNSGRGQRRSLKRELVKGRIQAVTDDFPRYLDVYDAQYPFTRSGQWSNHATTIQLRRQLGSVAAAAHDETFITNLHRTLRSWGIGKRASRIAPLDEFARALVTHLPQLEPMEGLRIDDPNLDIDQAVQLAWRFIESAPIVENRARIVAGTKTLHHLLPDLVPPIDREWTGAFFEWTLNDFQSRQERTFEEGFRSLHSVATAVTPTRFVGEGWRTSTSKLLDNAIIGFMLAERADVARAPSAIDLQMMTTAELHDLRDLIRQELEGRPEEETPQ